MQSGTRNRLSHTKQSCRRKYPCFVFARLQESRPLHPTVPIRIRGSGNMPSGSIRPLADGIPSPRRLMPCVKDAQSLYSRRDQRGQDRRPLSDHMPNRRSSIKPVGCDRCLHLWHLTRACRSKLRCSSIIERTSAGRGLITAATDVFADELESQTESVLSVRTRQHDATQAPIRQTANNYRRQRTSTYMNDKIDDYVLQFQDVSERPYLAQQ
jgi:hypothetical protein